MARYKLAPIGVIDTQAGNEHLTPASVRWAAYQAWVAQGNAADPPDPPMVNPAEADANLEVAARASIRAALRADPDVQALRGRDPSSVDAWVNASGNSIPALREQVRILARIVALLARERI